MSDRFIKEKQELQDLIKEKGWETIRIVLFDKKERLPFAIHLFEENGRYVIQSTDERGGFDGNPKIFDNFNLAKEGIVKQIELEIHLGKMRVEKVGYYDYPSPLWDKYAIQLEVDRIDAIGAVDSHLELLLIDSNHWFVKDEHDHLLNLQEKINNYIHYLESKQYVAQYGDNFEQKVINLTFQYSPSDNGLAFLAAVQKTLADTDMSLKLVLPE